MKTEIASKIRINQANAMELSTKMEIALKTRIIQANAMEPSTKTANAMKIKRRLFKNVTELSTKMETVLQMVKHLKIKHTHQPAVMVAV